MLANSGEMTPPCGVPSDVAVNTLWSMTPDFSQAFICCLTLPLMLSF
jgi:hypothetical protein